MPDPILGDLKLLMKTTSVSFLLLLTFAYGCNYFLQTPISLKHQTYETTSTRNKISSVSLSFNAQIIEFYEDHYLLGALFENADYQEMIRHYVIEELSSSGVLDPSARPKRTLTCNFKEISAIAYTSRWNTWTRVDAILFCRLDNPDWEWTWHGSGRYPLQRFASIDGGALHAVEDLLRAVIPDLSNRLKEVDLARP